MSILGKIIKIGIKAPRMTLYGRPGIGKSTLASEFASPLFILTEENKITGFDAFPVANSFEEIWGTVKSLLTEESLPYKTIIIDSVTMLDQLIIKYVIDQSPPGKGGSKVETISQAFGGYGAGFLKAASLHRAFHARLNKFQDRGVAVIYISHLEIKKCKLPDQEDYDTYTIIMNGDASRSVYIDDVDLVGFCKLKSHIVETDSGRNIVKSSSERVISVGVNDVHISKNRYGMPAEINMSYESLAKYIDFYNQEGEL